MLSFCQNCGNSLSGVVTKCPHCDYPVQNGHAPNPPSGTVPPPPRPTPGDGTAPGVAIPQHFETLRGLLHQYPVPGLHGPLSFLYRIHCPFCDYSFHPGDSVIYCEDHQHKLVELEKAPQTVLERSFARLYVRALDKGEYFQKKAQRACPRCHSLLPPGFESYPTFTIAVIGDTVSGKSHFITALLHLLKARIMGERGNIAVDFDALNEQTRAIFEKNDDTLFGSRTPLGITRETDNYTLVTPAQGSNGQAPEPFIKWDPLIFRLTMGYTEPEKPFRNNLFNLVFYDMSGELIVNDTTQRITWPISRAQGIIHVVDPLSMPGILPHLRQGTEVQAAIQLVAKRNRPDQVLRRVAFALVAKAGGNQQKSVSTPVAIMLSKSDLLDEFVRRRNFPSSFAKNPVYTGNVNIDEIDRISDEIKQLLEGVEESQLLNESQKFSRVKFFATSATGHALDQDNIFPKVEPRRCLDPFLWLLWELTGKK